jgi:hypothetical protein
VRTLIDADAADDACSARSPKRRATASSASQVVIADQQAGLSLDTAGRESVDMQQPREHRGQRMPTITTSDGTEIFYKDWGSGEPIVFSHTGVGLALALASTTLTNLGYLPEHGAAAAVPCLWLRRPAHR